MKLLKLILAPLVWILGAILIVPVAIYEMVTMTKEEREERTAREHAEAMEEIYGDERR